MISEKEVTWIRFVLAEQKPNTQVWHVLTKERQDVLGEIRWFGRWRQYVFFPSEDTAFSNGCLDEISAFLKELMDERKVKKKGECARRKFS